jgi:hypothetical protein
LMCYFWWRLCRKRAAEVIWLSATGALFSRFSASQHPVDFWQNSSIFTVLATLTP